MTVSHSFTINLHVPLLLYIFCYIVFFNLINILNILIKMYSNIYFEHSFIHLFKYIIVF